MPKPLVAIVGRPNVGKSTLFNRLIGERLAIVEDIPGTTRDRLYGDVSWGTHEFTVVDTGGLSFGDDGDLAGRVQAQAEVAIGQADVIVFVVDAAEGLTSTDEDVTGILRHASKPVILVANKAESAERRLAAADFYRLGLGEPLTVSSIHGTGTGDLLDEIVARLPAAEPEAIDETVPRIAIVGRPNVGKSSLFNALLGYERVLVDEVPGTTRDAVDTLIEHRGQQVLLIDTAGMRRRGRVEVGIEKYAVMRALRALSRADVALLVIDASEGVTTQDAHVGGYVVDAAKGAVIVANKWDLVPKDGGTMAQYTRIVRDRLKFLVHAPVVFVSALTGTRLPAMLDSALEVYAERQKRIPTARLNQVVRDAEDAHKPPSVRGRRLKINYATQAEINPPTFVFFVNDPKLLHFSYQRYLENRLREAFGFAGTAIRLVFRGKAEGERAQ